MPQVFKASSTEMILPAVKGRAVLVIHGGAGGLTRERYGPEIQEKYRAALGMALNAGHAVLATGGCALDAVEAAIRTMEDNPLFNAGKGAVLTAEGKVELEASVMVSHPGAAGLPASEISSHATRRVTAVTMIQRVKNPITLAKRLYLASKDSPHVIHAAPNAETLAQALGCEMAEEPYFHTPARDRQYQSADTTDYAGVGDGDGDAKGTVGAVALDIYGHIAVGTSTGGKGGKLPGRIGDTPIPGAGFWCESFFQRKRLLRRLFPFLSRPQKVGMGVSGTGDGDYFLRYSVCHQIYQRMKFKREKLETACQRVLRELGLAGGEGGVIAVTGKGEVVMGMNCAGMFRGWIDLAEATPRVAIFNQDRCH